jgi:transcription termination factor Rho
MDSSTIQKVDDSKTVKELKKIAKSLGLEETYDMKKAELIEYINFTISSSVTDEEETKELEKIAKQFGLMGDSKNSKVL